MNSSLLHSSFHIQHSVSDGDDAHYHDDARGHGDGGELELQLAED